MINCFRNAARIIGDVIYMHGHIKQACKIITTHRKYYRNPIPYRTVGNCASSTGNRTTNPHRNDTRRRRCRFCGYRPNILSVLLGFHVDVSSNKKRRRYVEDAS